MEHSEFNISYGNETRPFPNLRKNYEFVGDVFDKDDNRNTNYWKIIQSI